MSENIEQRLAAVEDGIAKLLRIVTVDSGLPQFGIKEVIRAGQVYSTSDDRHVILIFDSCTRTRDGLVHKWTHIKHFGKVCAARVNDNAEGFIQSNNMHLIGEISDFLQLPSAKEETKGGAA